MSSNHGSVYFLCTDDKVVHVEDDSVFKNVDFIRQAIENEGRYSHGTFNIPVESTLFASVVQFLKMHKKDDPNKPCEFVLTDWDRNFFMKNFDCFMMLISASLTLDVVVLYVACRKWINELLQSAKSSRILKRVANQNFKLDHVGIKIFDANDDLMEKIKVLRGTSDRAEFKGKGPFKSIRFENDKLVEAVPYPKSQTGQNDSSSGKVAGNEVNDSVEVVNRPSCSKASAEKPIEKQAVSAALGSEGPNQHTSGLGCTNSQTDSVIFSLLNSSVENTIEESDEYEDLGTGITAQSIVNKVERMCVMYKQKTDDVNLLETSLAKCIAERDELKNQVRDHIPLVVVLRKRYNDCKAERDHFKMLLDQQTSIKGPDKDLFGCQMCGLYFSSQIFLIEHLKKEHEK